MLHAACSMHPHALLVATALGEQPADPWMDQTEPVRRAQECTPLEREVDAQLLGSIEKASRSGFHARSPCHCPMPIRSTHAALVRPSRDPLPLLSLSVWRFTHPAELSPRACCMMSVACCRSHAVCSHPAELSPRECESGALVVSCLNIVSPQRSCCDPTMSLPWVYHPRPRKAVRGTRARRRGRGWLDSRRKGAQGAGTLNPKP